jgi:hypothetical protein
LTHQESRIGIKPLRLFRVCAKSTDKKKPAGA